MSAADNLIKEFCQSIGMGASGFNENKQRSLAFDDKVVITFLEDNPEQITAICFISELGKLENMRKLLEQNFLAEAHGGARFALEPNSDRVIMTKQWQAVKTTIPEFSNELEQFVNSAMQAQGFFSSGGAVETPVVEEGAPAVDTLAMAYQSI